MDNDACVAACAADGDKYAGTYRKTCYCASALGDARATANAVCNVLCPGSSLETCGGQLVAGSDLGPATVTSLTVTASNSTSSNTTVGAGGNGTNTTVTTPLIARARLTRRGPPPQTSCSRCTAT
jgi:hypothetical protein